MWDLSPEDYEGFLKVSLAPSPTRSSGAMLTCSQALYADSLVYGFSAWFTKVRAVETTRVYDSPHRSSETLILSVQCFDPMTTY